MVTAHGPKLVATAICLVIAFGTIIRTQDVSSFLGFWSGYSQSNWLLDTASEYRLTAGRRGTKEYLFEIEERELTLGGVSSRLNIVNQKYPGPLIDCYEGDLVRVKVCNRGSSGVSLHFHGLTQNGTNYMDGVAGVTQCTIAPGRNFTYEFVADRAGTFWYYSDVDESSNQITRGVTGPLIVRGDVDTDAGTVVLLTDAFSESVVDLATAFREPWIGGVMPRPRTALAQGRDAKTVHLDSGIERYRFVNAALDTTFQVTLDADIVELDGTEIEPQSAKSMVLAPGQRASFVSKQLNGSSPHIEAIDPSVGGLVYMVEHTIKSEKSPKAPPAAARTVYIDARQSRDSEGCAQACFNHTSRSHSARPLLERFFNLLPSESHMHQPGPAILAKAPYSFKPGETVDLVLNNLDSSGHSFHLHGHRFWVVERGECPVTFGVVDPDPIRRDTVWVGPNAWVRLRFVADNKGVWVFQSQGFWSQLMGMSTEFVVGAGDGLRPPQEWFDLCLD